MKKLLKKVVVFTLLVTMGTTLVACGKKESSGLNNAETTKTGPSTVAKEFVIGNAQPLTGINAQVGDAANKGANLAVKYINENGGINGSMIRLINYDDQGAPEEAVKIATKMIQSDKVDAVLGSLTSTCVLAAGKYYNDSKLVTFGTGNSPTWMEQGWEYVFRAGLNNGFSMPFLAAKMEALGIQKVSVFQGLDDASKTTAEAFIEACKENNVEILAVESYTDGDTDFSGQVAKIINTNPDVVFCSSNGPTQAIFAKQLRQLGYEGIAFNREGLTGDIINVAGDAANYWAFSYPYVTYKSPDEATDPDMKNFLLKFYDEYNEMPYHDCAYRSWDALMTLTEAARIAGSNDSNAIRQAIGKIKDFKVLAGILDFTDGTGEGLHSLNTYIVIDGNFTDFDAWYEAEGTLN